MGKNEQGISTDRYLVIPRVLVFIFNDKKVLLLKGAPDKRLWANQFNGVGGHIERGEDIYQAACRELLEETGLTAANLHMVGTLMVDASDSIGVGIYIWQGTYSGGKIKASKEGMLEWIDVTRLENLPAVPDLKTILKTIAARQPGDPPFSARSYYDSNDQLQVEVSLS